MIAQGNSCCDVMAWLCLMHKGDAMVQRCQGRRDGGSTLAFEPCGIWEGVWMREMSGLLPGLV